MSKKSDEKVIKDERDAEKLYQESEKRKEEEKPKQEPPPRVKAPGTTGPRYPAA